MTLSANFQVDPRLAALLGENYRSLEKALKELIDNTWDANAETVSISLPDLWEKGPIVIHDDGTGMTEKEVRSDYLAIASPRASRKGKYTPLKNRRVKGRKGIGKFAGLVMAGEMKIETRRNGQFTPWRSPNRRFWRLRATSNRSRSPDYPPLRSGGTRDDDHPLAAQHTVQPAQRGKTRRDPGLRIRPGTGFHDLPERQTPHLHALPGKPSPRRPTSRAPDTSACPSRS
jgi:hypothetical protein